MSTEIKVLSVRRLEGRWYVTKNEFLESDLLGIVLKIMVQKFGPDKTFQFMRASLDAIQNKRPGPGLPT